MHWVVQEDLWHEEGMEELIRVLDRYDLPYSLVKVIPFVGELIPDVNPDNPVIAIGAYSMINTARRRGWIPGVWSGVNFDFTIWWNRYCEHCLNNDAEIMPFRDVPKQAEPFFIRPTLDNKAFSGKVYEKWDEFHDWQNRVVDLGENIGSPMNADTLVLVCSPKEILREYRLWVVDQRIVTASLYKMGDRVCHDEHVERDVIEFGRRLVQMWVPDRAFVLDVCLTPDGYRVVEINSLNAAGLYACNVGRLVEALEGMGYN